MSELGDFLERVYGSGDPCSTVRAQIRHWCNKDLEKHASHSKHTFGRLKVDTQSAARTAKIKQAELSIWANPPTQYRVEVVRAGEIERSLEIVNGTCQWNRDRQGHVEIAEGKAGRRSSRNSCPTDIARHFDNALLREMLCGLILAPAGRVQTAGRECIRLRAVPRPGGQLWPHWMPSGADEYELHADIERGVLLYIAGRFGDALYEVNEVAQVTFDEPLDEGLFTYVPDYGEQVGPATPIVERMSIEEAVAKMTFTVLVPAHLPQGIRTMREVMYHPSRLPASRPSLAMLYSGSDHSQTFWIEQSGEPDPEMEELEWAAIEQGGKAMAISDVPGDEGYRIIMLKQAGTHVKIWSELARQPLLDIAASLVPAASPKHN